MLSAAFCVGELLFAEADIFHDPRPRHHPALPPLRAQHPRPAVGGELTTNY